MKKIFLVAFFASLQLFLSGIAIAANGDLALDAGSVRFSKSVFIEGQKVRIYATSVNTTSKDLYGVVRFFEEESGKQIGADQPISVFAGKTDDVFVDWIPPAGGSTIKVELIPFDPDGDVTNNNFAEKKVFVEADFDRDGTPDGSDEDDDNDGANDGQDVFPKNKNEQKDTDGDGKGNNEDTDDDNDNFPDSEDALPEDQNEYLDADKDGIGDKADPDDDNDGVYDGEEIAQGTDPVKSDTDGDKVVDGKDAFPTNPTEQKDTDKDGTGNKKDSDDDNDTIPDQKDPFPENLPPMIETGGGIASILVQPKKEITFDASTSTDPDGKITKVTWKIDNEGEKEGLIVSHTFQDSGKHTIVVKATDDSGETVSKEYTIYATRTGSLIAGILLLVLLGLAIWYLLQYSSARRARHMRK